MHTKDALTVITGASSGLGLALAQQLAAQGARVVLLARTASALEEHSQAIRAAGGWAAWYAVDLTDAAAVAAVVEQIKREHGVPSILINNAGSGRFLALEETEPAEMQAMLAAPCFAAFYITRAMLPDMLKQRRGLIVNVTSPASRIPWPGATIYATARWAMRGFDSALRADLSRTPLRTMLVTPGKITSSYFDNNPGAEARIPWIARLVPSLSPADVATAVIVGIHNDRRAVTVPWQLRFFFRLHSLMPGLVEWLSSRTGWRRP